MNEFIAGFITFLVAVLTGLFYIRLLKRERPSITPVIHNLPSPPSQIFVGRAKPIAQLHEFLSPKELRTIAGVFGMAGIGKTTLLIEIGRECVKRKSFELVFYIPADQFSISEKQHKKDDVLDTIISTVIYLIDFKQSKLSASEKEVFVRTSFTQKRTLLLIDGLDETSEQEKKFLLKFLSSLPSQTKVIISSRQRINVQFIVYLDALTFEEYSALLSNELLNTNTTNINKDTIKILYYLTGGLPLSAEWISSLMSYYSMDTIINIFKQGSERLFNNSQFEFILEPIISKYRKKYPYNELLTTLAHLPNMVTLPKIAHEAGLANNLQLVEKSLVDLTQASLLSKCVNKYIMHPLIKKYILSKEKIW